MPVGVGDWVEEVDDVDDVDELDGEAGKVSEALDGARAQNSRASDSALESSSAHCEETQPTRSRGKTPLFAKSAQVRSVRRRCRKLLTWSKNKRRL